MMDYYIFVDDTAVRFVMFVLEKMVNKKEMENEY